MRWKRQKGRKQTPQHKVRTRQSQAFGSKLAYVQYKRPNDNNGIHSFNSRISKKISKKKCVCTAIKDVFRDFLTDLLTFYGARGIQYLRTVFSQKRTSNWGREARGTISKPA